MRITAIEHVQLAMPPGKESEAREFYAGLLGIPEVPKPPDLAKRGGAWFERGSLKIHLGVEADFRPARKAHPALLVVDLPALVAAIAAEAREGDQILVMSNGGFGGIHQKLIAALQPC